MPDVDWNMLRGNTAQAATGAYIIRGLHWVRGRAVDDGRVVTSATWKTSRMA